MIRLSKYYNFKIVRAQKQEVKEDLWGYVPQEFDSKNTSQKQNPSAIQYYIRMLQKNPQLLQKDHFNLDIGGGRWNLGTDLLGQQKIKNYVYDPFNRTKEENDLAASTGRGGKAPSVTVSNVLNVIKEPAIRERVIKQAADALSINGVAVFSIYEGSKENKGSRKSQMTINRNGSRSWQNFFPTADYLPEIQKYFKEVTKHNNIIVAKGPIVNWR